MTLRIPPMPALARRLACSTAAAISLGAPGAQAATAVTAALAAMSPGAAVAQSTMTAADAARLLDQATFGPTPGAIAAVQAQGAAAFVDAQLSARTTGLSGPDYIDANSAIGCPTGSAATCFRDNYTAFPLQLQFFRNAVSAPDQLRQRVAFAYSQIFVISAIDIKPTYGMRAYQQMLLENAFSNYRQILERVTLSPAMGDYLDMVNNNKPSGTVQANENYAREVLQLFSIGLSKLNADGSVVKNASGAAVPSYDQAVVTSFARAFTGWTYAPRPNVTSKWTNTINYVGDMVSFDAHHDVAAKTLLDGKVLPAGQTATQDLAGALDAIFNHPNVGPFIGRQLVQALVTSNPTPAYVARITAVFNNNGAGVRGDMRAVVRAILLDPEARGDARTGDVVYGKLRDPAVYAAGLLRAFGGFSDGVYLNAQSSAMGQGVFTAPSVFSFYPPDYALPNSATLVGPQFGVANTTTTDARLNFAYALLYSTKIAADASVPNSTGTQVDLSAYTAVAGSSAALVSKLNADLLYSTLAPDETAAIAKAVDAIAVTDSLGRARMAAYLVATSPRYQINR